MKSYNICHVCCGKWSLIFIHQVTYKLTLFLSFFLYIYSLDFFAYQSIPSLIFFFTLHSVALHRYTVTQALGPLSVGIWVASSFAAIISASRAFYGLHLPLSSISGTHRNNELPSQLLLVPTAICVCPPVYHAHTLTLLSMHMFQTSAYISICFKPGFLNLPLPQSFWFSRSGLRSKNLYLSQVSSCCWWWSGDGTLF